MGEIQQEIKSLASTFQKRAGCFGEQVPLGYSKGPDEGHTLVLHRSPWLPGHYISPAESPDKHSPFLGHSTMKALAEPGCPIWQPCNMCRFMFNFKLIGSYEANWRHRP